MDNNDPYVNKEQTEDNESIPVLSRGGNSVGSK